MMKAIYLSISQAKPVEIDNMKINNWDSPMCQPMQLVSKEK